MTGKYTKKLFQRKVHSIFLFLGIFLVFALKKIKQRAKKGRNKSTLDIVIFDDFSCVAFEWKKKQRRRIFLVLH